ncbi:IS3 family transposase [Erwinia sp. BC051422]|uniref:IS3 family transposase n=1 Tax=Erwinia wuhanensis TaxID=3045167 RepID=UPI00264B631C|nr:IS3 family transposase [Erwinia sp. BC051422]MDN8542666.1 IS3 family transposase [Erwinia sp. BC051422]
MVEVLSGPERRRRRTPQEKIAIIQQTMEPGMTVSHVARLHGINANQIFKWRRQYEDGSLTAVASGEEVVPASELAAANKQIRELQRLLGKKTMEAEILKEAVEFGRGKKMDCACALVARRRRLTDVSRSIGVSRAQLSIRVHRPPDWQDRRRQPRSDDSAVLSRINTAVSDLPTYGYRRVWTLLRRESERGGLPVVNAKRVYRIMKAHHLLLERKPADPRRKCAHKGRVAVAESNRRWCSDGFEFRCDNGEKLRVTFAQDCCDREIIDWAAGTGGYDKETVQDVMLGAVEKRFGRQLPTESLEWLTDNGSAYRAHETRAFARMLGLEPCTTAVRSPESNGIAESFVKTIKRDYISCMPKPDSQTAVMNLAVAFTHYNEHHPHSALGYRSPREYIRRKLSQP